MEATITTTIRWDSDELEDVKQAAKLVGLPVSLFIKSIALSKIRRVEEIYDPVLYKKLALSRKEAEENKVDIFYSKKDLIADLKKRMKK